MRRYQYTLRGFLLFSGICAGVLALAITVPQEATPYLLGFVYSFLMIMAAVVLTWPADSLLHRMPLAASIPAMLAGYFLLMSAFYLFGGAIEQSHLVFAGGNWVARRARESVLWGAHFVVVMALLTTVDAVMQFRRRDGIKDFAYYPRVAGLVKSLSLVQGRLVLIVGFLVLFGAYVMTAVEEWGARVQILPTEVAFGTCVLGWAVLWIADCLSRPRRSTVWVAIAFLLYGLLALPAGVIVRE